MSVPALSGGFGGWFSAAILLWLAAAAMGLARPRANGPWPAVLVGVGSGLTLVAALAGGDERLALPLPWFLGTAGFDLVADPLSRWFLGIIGLVGVAVAVFAGGYLQHLRKRVALGFVWAALAALLASMSGVVLASNAVLFLVAWEVMALSSFALVAADHAQHSVRHAALVYLGATRAGTAFLMGGFLWAHQLTGSWDFAAWTLSGRAALGPALLIFIGLATKAGCWPFHLWLPIAHPAAPAPVSALMSGVMIKTAIYAMARLFTGHHLDAPGLAPLVLGLGAVSAFWGVLFALLQHDLKRLLAYHSVENIGIILMGLGLAMAGQRLGLPLLAGLGLAAALFHSLNHAVFKSLLFLGAGAIDARAHTRDLEHLGGLIHRMPWTAACFITGSAAICALPPLNGFASEWLLYRAFFELARSAESVGLRAGGLLLMGWLALVGALALACFVKAAGVVFLGRPRSREAARAREASRTMVTAQVGLAVACAALGLGASALLAPLSRIAAGAAAAPGVAATWVLPLPLLALLLGGTVFALAALGAALARMRPARRYVTWECGFGDLGPRTQYTATSFAQPIARLFGAVYRYHLEVAVAGRDRRHFPESVTVTSTHEPYLETRLYAPLVQLIQRAAGTFVMRLQAGSIHQYLLYIVLALGLLLWIGYRG
jgi:hydrogenase-4 component B